MDNLLLKLLKPQLLNIFLQPWWTVKNILPRVNGRISDRRTDENDVIKFTDNEVIRIASCHIIDSQLQWGFRHICAHNTDTDSTMSCFLCAVGTNARREMVEWVQQLIWQISFYTSLSRKKRALCFRLQLRRFLVGF